MAYRLLALALALCMTTFTLRADDLNSILELAIESDPRVRISELQVEIGQAQDDQAFGRMLPSLTASGQLSDIDRTDLNTDAAFNPKDSYTGERYSLSGQQMLYNRETIKNRKRTRNLVKQYKYEFDDVLASVLLDVSEKYLTVLGNQDNLTLVRSEKDSVLKRLEQFEKLYDKRLIKITDLLDAQVRRDQILADEIEVETSVLVAKEALRSLTGTDIGELAPLVATASYPVLDGYLGDWVERARINSPVLLARQKAVDAARAGLAQARGSRWPTFNLQFSFLDSDRGFENARVNRNESKSVAVVFNMPLFAGGINLARTREAHGQLSLERMRREETLRGIILSVKESYVTAYSSVKRISAAEAQSSSANKAHEAMEKSFQYGTVTAIDVIEALQRKFEADRDLLRARYTYLLAWLQLAYYSGELSHQQIATINAMLER